MKQPWRHGLVFSVAAGLIGAWAAAFIPAEAVAQNETGIDEYEYEEDEGLHQEEWYDPSDWFTGLYEEGVHYEDDDWDYDGYDEYDPGYRDVYYEDNDYALDEDRDGIYLPDDYRDEYYDVYGYEAPEAFYDEYSYDYLQDYDDFAVDDYARDEEEQWYDPSDFDYEPWEYDYDDDVAGEDMAYGYYEEPGGDWEYGWHYEYQTDDHEVNQRDSRQRRQQQPRPTFRRVDATIGRLNTVNVRGDDQPHRIARLQTRGGRQISADLGRANEIGRLDLQQGDRIRVVGSLGRMDDKRILVAHAVGKDDEWSRVKRSSEKLTRSFRGTVASLREASFKDGDRRQIVGRINLLRGPTTQVVLGPKDKVRNVDLRPGDRLKFKARATRVNGRPALAATHVNLIGGGEYDAGLDRQFTRRTAQATRQKRRPQTGGKFVQVRGEIEKLNERRIKEKTHLFTTLNAGEDREATVDLGPKKKAAKLDLSQGDTVRVYGVRARLKDQQVVRAGAVEFDDQWHELARAQLPQKRLSGEVLRTRASDDGTIATIRLTSGQKVQVLLSSRVEADEEISGGELLTFWARPGSVDGEPGLIANRIRGNKQQTSNR